MKPFALETKYGQLKDITTANYYENGSLKDCILSEQTTLNLPCGKVTPHYSYGDVRRKYTKSVSFYESGEIKTVSLEAQTEVMTPMGEFPAEFVTFYKNGNIKRIFPLNGKLTGYWSELDEAQMAIPFNFEFDFGSFTTKITAIHFYENGNIKSLSLWPGESVTLNTPVGAVSIKTGFSLYENGKLKTIEPSCPTPIRTPIGVVTAFDPNSIGIHADNNSLEFDENGNLIRLVTANNKIIAFPKGGEIQTITPSEQPHPLEDDASIPLPLEITFTEDYVQIICEVKYLFKMGETTFTILPHVPQSPQCGSGGCSDCSSCSGCGV
ncbi:MAG: hypothetical protein K0R90_1348 [Oscillospiraceae bacterium]|nr:hypothetical protein [Oscillospiraceae bacterium]